MNILIFEAYTDANIGSGSLIENSINVIKKFYPDGRISLLAHNRDAVHEFTGLPSCYEVFRLPFNQSRLKQVFWLLKNAIWIIAHFFTRISRLPIHEKIYTFDKLRLESIKAIKDSDVCVSIGAERINDNFYLGLPFSLFTSWMIKSYGKRLIAFPQTIGPFHFKASRYFSKKILSSYDRIYVRDRRSEDTLGSIGISGSKFTFVPDIALLQKPCKESETIELMRMEGIPQARDLCALSVMEWTYFKTGKEGSNYKDYKNVLSKATDYLVEKYGYHTVFIPTNLLMRGCREDDVKTQDEIYELVSNKNSVTRIRNLYKPGQIKGLFKKMDMVIATRMHACILATGAHAPTLSINYQFKLYEYMKLLGLGSNTVDIEDLSFDKLKALIDHTYSHRAEIRKQLAAETEKLQAIINERLVI